LNVRTAVSLLEDASAWMIQMMIPSQSSIVTKKTTHAHSLTAPSRSAVAFDQEWWDALSKG